MLRIALLLALAAATPARRTGAPEEEQPLVQALLVGCGEYPALRQAFGRERYEREVRLLGPLADVGLVRATLERVLGLEPGGTTVLVGWGEDPATRPTRANVLAALARLAEDARPGSRAIVYLAGHGSQQPVQREKPDEPDGLDELFLPADVGRAEGGWIPNAIQDDELGAALCAIRDAGADVWLIVDSCHSGTMLRGGADELVRLRWLDPVELGVPAPRARRGAPPSGWIGRTEPRIAALYGSQSYGRAPEMPIPREGGEVRGLFTWLLCQELERTRGRLSYRELSERVVAAYQAFPCSLTVPAAEGDLEREVASGATLDGPPLLCTWRAGEPWLNQGRFAGLEPGARVRVSRVVVGERQALALLEVVEAGAFEARCRILAQEQGPGEPALAALAATEPLAAEIEARAGHDWSLALATVRPDGTHLAPRELPEHARRLLEEQPERFRLVAPVDADWCLVVAESGRTWLRPGPREGGHDLLDVAPAELGRRLRSLQTTRNLRRAARDFAAADGERELDVWIERKDARGRAQRLEPGAVLRPGEEIRVRLEKQSARIYDVNVFYLDANLLRQSLCARRLEAGADAALALTDWVSVTDDALGLEQLVVLATPRQPADPRLDLGWLADDTALRGAPATPLGQLLSGLHGGRDLRGEPFGADPELDATRSLLVGLRTAWGPIRAPAWPAGERLELAFEPSVAEAPIAGPGASPDARSGVAELGSRGTDAGSGAGADFLVALWSAGERAALARSAGEGPPDTLFLGDEQVRAVLLDLDGQNGLGEASGPEARSRALAERRFDAEAAFLFASDGRYAGYDSRGDGLDRVLVDRDLDGVAEELQLLEEGRWRVFGGMALPWLSQQHLGPATGSRRERTARLALLQEQGAEPR